MFFKLTADQVLVFDLIAGLCQVHFLVVRKPVNANPGLKVNQSINFSCIKTFFTAFVLYSVINREPHRKVTKLKSKFSLIIGSSLEQTGPGVPLLGLANSTHYY